MWVTVHNFRHFLKTCSLKFLARVLIAHTKIPWSASRCTQHPPFQSFRCINCFIAEKPRFPSCDAKLVIGWYWLAIRWLAGVFLKFPCPAQPAFYHSEIKNMVIEMRDEAGRIVGAGYDMASLCKSFVALSERGEAPKRHNPVFFLKSQTRHQKATKQSRTRAQSSVSKPRKRILLTKPKKATPKAALFTKSQRPPTAAVMETYSNVCQDLELVRLRRARAR